MKRHISLLLALLVCLFLVACKPAAQPAALDVEAEATAIIEKYSLSSGNRYSSASTVEGEYLDEELIRSYYGDAAEMPDFDSVEAYAVYIDESMPIRPCEFGIFKMKEGADKELFMAFLQARIDMKLLNAQAYPTTDTEPLTTAKVASEGDYVWYCAVKGGNEEIHKTLLDKLG